MLTAPLTPHLVKNLDESPIFVIGTGRSGTTLLRQMLNAHPRIHLTHEAGFYSYARHAVPNTSTAEWLDRYFQTFSYAWLRLPPEEVLRQLPKDLPFSQIDVAFRAIMRQKAHQQGKPRYGEKNPLDTHNLPTIFRNFADPRVIYITRDPRPTVLSYNRMPFGTGSTLLNTWICRIQFEHIQPFLDRILEVRLEDLVSDSRTVLQSILRFVGEPWHESVLDHVRHSATDDVPPLPWFVGATREQPNQETSRGGWLEKMDPAWIRLVERFNRPTMERYGYEPAALKKEPGYLALAGALLRDFPDQLKAAYRLLAFKRKLDRHFQGKQLLDPQQGMEANIALNPSAWQNYPKFEMPRVPALLPAHRDSA